MAAIWLITCDLDRVSAGSSSAGRELMAPRRSNCSHEMLLPQLTSFNPTALRPGHPTNAFSHPAGHLSWSEIDGGQRRY
jgi:hypothetical protein